MRYYLGLDGGGTKTAACILDESRRELGRGAGGPCNIATGALDSLRDSVLTATRQALDSAGLPPDTRFEAVCAGVAGYTAKRRRAEFTVLLSHSIPAIRHRLEPDFVIAWWGATEGKPGIIVSAGTGAVVYGRNEEGESHRRDGRGFLLGDHGSAFDIGRQALWTTLYYLGEQPVTRPLALAVLEEIGAVDADDLIEWVYRDFSPARIAGLAALVGAHASTGDEDAVALIESSARLLRTQAREVMNWLGLPQEVPIYGVGGLWNLGSTIKEPFCRESGELAPRWPAIELLEPAHDAAYGAALLAMQADEDA